MIPQSQAQAPSPPVSGEETPTRSSVSVGAALCAVHLRRCHDLEREWRRRACELQALSPETFVLAARQPAGRLKRCLAGKQRPQIQAPVAAPKIWGRCGRCAHGAPSCASRADRSRRGPAGRSIVCGPPAPGDPFAFLPRCHWGASESFRHSHGRSALREAPCSAG